MLRLTAPRSGLATLSFVVSAEGAFDTLTGTRQTCTMRAD